MPGAWLRRLWGLSGEQRGGVGPLLAIMMIPLIATLGVATESSSWFLIRRAAQNAADSASMAAALAAACTPAATCKTTYSQEAAVVATRYGFTDGDANTTVATTQLACPSDATLKCYQVTISRSVPIALGRLVGFNGNVDLDGGRGQRIVATAIASQSANPTYLCLDALAWAGGVGIDTNGAGSAFTGCSVGTNGSASCNNPQGATSTIATNSDAACGGPVSTKQLDDPYALLKSKIPSSSCTSGSKTKITASTLALDPSTPVVWCNGAQLQTDVTTSGTGVIVIYKVGNSGYGNFDPNGHTLKSGSGSGVTLIFTGSATGSAAQSGMIEPNSKVGSSLGTVDIAAPISGTWSGMAVYTNPDQSQAVSYTPNGQNATVLKITGAVYMPHAQMTFNGSFNKATNGLDCLALVVDTFRGNGALKEQQTQCSAAGLTPPTGGSVQREALVQ